MQHLKYPVTFFFLLLITTAFSQENYHWVGGQGAWSDLTHWQLDNGSTPNDIPGSQDNVIFNDSSFPGSGDTVFVVNNNATCKNFSCLNSTHSFTIAGGADTTEINIAGSFMLSGLTNWQYLGKLKFSSSEPNNTIATYDNLILNNVLFDGTGEWILQDDFIACDTTGWIAYFYSPKDNKPPNPVINIKKGTFRTNGKKLVCEGFASSEGNQRTIDIRNSDSIFVFKGAWAVNGENLNLLSENSKIYVQKELKNTNGGPLTYNSAYLFDTAAIVKNTNIHTIFHKIETKYDGKVKGSDQENLWGTFKIDSVILHAGPNTSTIIGQFDTIYYGELEGTGRIAGHDHLLGSIYYKSLFLPGTMEGEDNSVDSLFMLTGTPTDGNKGVVSGNNAINYALFQTIGILTGENTGQNLFFESDGEFLKNNEIYNLHLTSGCWYKLGSDSLDMGSNTTHTFSQKIHNIEIEGDCNAGIVLLTSNHQTTPAYLNYLGGAYNTSLLAVRDIWNEGNPMTVTDGKDLGNNQNITFVDELVGKEMYWVNGTGNWSDNYHWSYTSGVTENRCPPTPVDNVHVDANSGIENGTINLDVRYAQCKDLIYDPSLTNGGTIQGGAANNLMIWGSLQLLPDMENTDFSGQTFFESDHDLTYENVYTGDFDFFNRVTFEGNEGKWQVSGPFNVLSDTVYHLFGTLNLYDELNYPDDTTREFFIFAATDTMPRHLILGKSHIFTHGFMGDNWILNAKNMTFESGTSTITSDPWGPPPVPMMGNISTIGVQDSIVYHNIEFLQMVSMLNSGGYCKYNVVTFKQNALKGMVVGMANIDTLNFIEGADFCALKNNDTINVFWAESSNDTIIGGHFIHQAHFFQPGVVMGWNEVDSLHFHPDALATLDIGNMVNKGILEEDASLMGNNQFNRLWLSPGKKYTLQSDSVQTIHEHLYASGGCTEPILFEASTLGHQANLLAEYDPVEIYYSSLTDMNAVPYNGNTYTAYSSIDIANNTNWNFEGNTSQDFYWINGTGVWSDPLHWSYESGGPPNADACIPREMNDVYFDENSFNLPTDVVTVDITHALCHSMFWIHPDTDEPTFLGEETSDLNIYGSLHFSPTMNYQFKGKIIFSEFGGGNSGIDSIETRGQTLVNDVTFNGLDDHWKLGDSLTIDSGEPDYDAVLTLENGDLNTNSQNVSTNFFYSDFDTERKLTMDHSKFSLTGGNDTTWMANHLNLTFSADSSLLSVEGTGGIVMNYNTNDISTDIEFYDVACEMPLEVIENKDNHIRYHDVNFNAANCEVKHESGYINITGRLSFNSSSCKLENSSTTHQVYSIDSANFSQINGVHLIDEAIMYGYGNYISGLNSIHYGYFNNDSHFQGENEFDTLILKPGFGATYYFQPNKAQVIHDQLLARGNNCFSMTLTSENSLYTAQISKDTGVVVCDFLELNALEATGGATFYAGSNSTEQNPSPGWIFEDGEGYIYGFPHDTAYICGGDSLFVDTEDFNTDENTLFFWKEIGESNFTQGGNIDTITSPGIYVLNLKYNGVCDFWDTLTVLNAIDPQVSLFPGPYCEGDTVHPVITPDNLPYTYEWFNGNTDSTLITELSYNNENVWLQITDTSTRCSSIDTVVMSVLDKPHPELYLVGDTTLEFGTHITLDAGPGGTSYLWTNDNPSIPIDHPDKRTITGYGMDVPVTYTVNVTNSAGCSADASVKLGLYPPCKYDVPNAFTPNGDKRNDVFFVKGPVNGYKELNLMIFNRYGEMVFRTNDITKGWDGTVNGNLQESEVFTFHLIVNCIDGGIVEKSGNITLIR